MGDRNKRYKNSKMGEKERDQNTTLGKNILNFALIIRLQFASWNYQERREIQFFKTNTNLNIS